MPGFHRLGDLGRFGGLVLLVGGVDGVDGVVFARRKVLAQRHPMAAADSFGVGRFVGGQIT
jgi:hypothetical protein